jgi:hypothetical protein
MVKLYSFTKGVSTGVISGLEIFLLLALHHAKLTPLNSVNKNQSSKKLLQERPITGIYVPFPLVTG